jgi:hypothetical protein
MARYFIFPNKDATIYEDKGIVSRKYINSGKDEILQLEKNVVTSNVSSNSRALIAFQTSDIQKVLNEEINTNNFTASLRLYTTENFSLGQTQSIEVYPVAEFWQNGTGHHQDSPQKTDGASWVYRTDKSLNQPWTTASYTSGTTGSFSGSATGTMTGGGVWYTQSAWYTSSTYNLASSFDLDFNITPAVLQHYSGNIDNNGFILKRSNVQERSSEELGTLNWFSLDTHTIYPPAIEFKWDDSSYDTGSLSLVGEEFDLNVKNNTEIYNRDAKKKFRLFARSKFPARSFATSSVYLTGNSIPSSSYYSIRDAYTEEIVIPFDDYSKISHDSTSPYFTLNFQGLQPERYYRMLFKLKFSGRTEILDDDYLFKVVR